MNCRVCHSSKIRSQFYGRNFRCELGGCYPYFQCSECNSISLARIPENLTEYYGGYYSLGQIDSLSCNEVRIRTQLYSGLSSSFAKYFLTRSRDLVHHSLAKIAIGKSQTILDVGSGSGQLISELNAIGFKHVEGIDPFIDKDIQYENGCSVRKLRIDECSGKWDWIMLNHVFEHTEDCHATLKSLSDRLARGGKIILRIPNVDSYAFRIFRENWYGLQAPLHIVLPSFKGMNILCDRHGFRIRNFLGENSLDLWLHSATYELDIWDGDSLSVYSLYGNRDKITWSPLFLKSQINKWKQLNKKVLRKPILCDWVCYVLEKNKS